ncbi:NUDIX domain-containing protein [Salinibacterium sp. dk2585]|uniref:NUDIX hydrolase n=1 Tax=unclassified Salinibacterium TaxID=2632331 RepID=UPI0011C256F4|nr:MULTISPECIES: NUDIX domain-containing protein [unclassified Salinibacterium]QEE60514.1 NUDIX domain-containing protein [Salinibacterium sp. dk2585]TXK55586.1 NUDIX domain-containing protein [Salinibacterium sp. dk5596]
MTGGVFTLAAALVLDSRGRALLVRKQGTNAFMQPGGKIEPGETARDAVVRELAEELTLEVDPDSLTPLGRFSSAAANEPGWMVDCEVFTLVTDAPVAAAAEIAEVRWFDPADTGDAVIAPLTVEHVFPAVPLVGGS